MPYARIAIVQKSCAVLALTAPVAVAAAAVAVVVVAVAVQVGGDIPGPEAPGLVEERRLQAVHAAQVLHHHLVVLLLVLDLVLDGLVLFVEAADPACRPVGRVVLLLVQPVRHLVDLFLKLLEA